MNDSTASLNKQISALVDQYANGSLAAAEYRQQRRALICQFTGESLPQVEEDGSGDATHPGIPAVKAPASTDTAVEPEVSVAPRAAKSNKSLYILITAVTVLVALAGAGGLFWFIFRE